MPFVDLHLHTTHSDGRWGPRRVVEEAARAGLAAISITDHDVLGGLAEARTAADEHGIRFVDGVELTAVWNGRVCHLLGYGIDPTSPGLVDALERGRRQMADYVAEFLSALRAAGHELGEADLARYNTRYTTGVSLVLGMLERGILSGPHARPLLALARREPRAYTAEQAIDLIHQAGGLAVVAHPARLRRDEPLLPAETFAPLLEAGLDGLEVWQIVQNQVAREHYRAVAAELGLLETGGSDCHGPRSNGVRLGSQRVPFEVFNALEERLLARRAERSTG